jgi:excisionase family DNA binding protein
MEQIVHDRLLKAVEVAETCGVKVETVLKWARTGKLNAVRLSSRCIRYERAAVETLLAKARKGKGGSHA